MSALPSPADTAERLLWHVKDQCPAVRNGDPWTVGRLGAVFARVLRDTYGDPQGPEGDDRASGMSTEALASRVDAQEALVQSQQFGLVRCVERLDNLEEDLGPNESEAIRDLGGDMAALGARVDAIDSFDQEHWESVKKRLGALEARATEAQLCLGSLVHDMDLVPLKERLVALEVHIKKHDTHIGHAQGTIEGLRHGADESIDDWKDLRDDLNTLALKTEKRLDALEGAEERRVAAMMNALARVGRLETAISDLPQDHAVTAEAHRAFREAEVAAEVARVQLRPGGSVFDPPMARGAGSD